mmetsp:Transcript_99847/g.237971  ORF Transcript_99847/g.237971 Transcript_99847/m.237971 type:complete len:216 (-) Transcript_99847:1381-2028(-)
MANTSSRSKSSASCRSRSSSFSRCSSWSFSWSSSFLAYSSACMMALLLGPSPALFWSIATSICCRMRCGWRRYKASWSSAVARLMASKVTLDMRFFTAIQAFSSFSAASLIHSYSSGKPGNSLTLPPLCFMSHSRSPWFCLSGWMKVGSSRYGGSSREGRGGALGAFATGHRRSAHSAASASRRHSWSSPFFSCAWQRLAKTTALSCLDTSSASP